MTREFRHIRTFLVRRRRRLVVERLLNDWFLIAAIALGAGAGLGAAFTVFPWTGLAYLVDAVAALGATAAAVSLVARLAFRPSLLDIARRLERLSGNQKSLLSAALQLDADTAASPELVALAQQRAAQMLDACPRHIPGVIRPGRLAAALLAAVLAAVALTATKPSLLAYWDVPLRLMKPLAVRIEPGAAAFPAGDTITLRAIPSERRFPSARLTLKNIDRRRSEQRLIRPAPDGEFSYAFVPAPGRYAYQFTIGAGAAPAETLTVVAPPTLFSISVAVRPPAYTGRPRRTLREGDGSMAVYAGSKAVMSIASHFPLREARLLGDWGDTVALRVDADSATGEITLWQSGRYSFSLVDTLGQRADSLPSFYVDLTPDYPPAARIIKPGVSRALRPAQQETLWVEGVDDIAVDRLSLMWRRGGDSLTETSRRNISVAKRQAIVRREIAWNLAELGLYPGDTLYYWARVSDNRPWKTQSAVSDTFWFRVPSFAEIHQQIARREDRTEQALETVQERQGDMKDQLQKLMRSSRQRESLSWEDKKILKDLDQSMRSQADSLRHAIDQLDNTVSDLKQQGVLDDAVARKMDEVREALKELLEHYGDSLLFENLEEANDVAWKDIQDAVEKMNQMLPDLQQHLDNTLKYLDMLRRDQDLAQLAARAENLARQQLRIAESKADDRLERQKQQSNEVDDLLEDIGDGMRADSGGPLVDQARLPSMDQARRLQRQLDSRIARQRMPPQSTMSQMSGALQSMSQELSSMQSSAMMQQAQKDREMLMSMAEDALHLAQWQKELAQDANGARSPRERAANQQALKEALRKSVGKLDSLRVISPNLLRDFARQGAQAQSAIDRSLDAMSGKQPGPALKGAMVGLNGYAGALLSGLESMQQGGQSGSGGSGGLMPGMRKLSGKQAAVNAATGEMLRQMLEGRGQREGGQSPGSVAEARAQAQAAQKELAEQLKQLADRYGNEAGEGMRRRMKELEQEARRLARMLENPSRQLQERQDRFLVRMLQTTLSTHKEGEGKQERKSSSATELFSDRDIQTPAEAFRDADTFYNLRSRALEGNYPEAYRLSVQSYFDSLGVLFLRQGQ
jgi:uncharacterized protein YukE